MGRLATSSSTQHNAESCRSIPSNDADLGRTRCTWALAPRAATTTHSTSSKFPLSRSLCQSHTRSPSSLPPPGSRGAASVAQPRAQPRSCGTAKRSGYCTAGNPVFGFGYLRVHSHSVGLISLTIRWRECSGQCHCALPFWHQSHHFKHKGCNDDPLYRQLCIVLRHCDPQLNSHAQRTRSVQWAFPLSSYVNGSS